jgi:DNA mismatch repair protein MutS2
MVPPIDAAGVSDPEDRGFARGAREQIGALRQPAEPARVHGFEVTVGARVRVRSLGVEGEVAEVRGDRITVQLPLAKTTVTREDLEPAAARKQGRSMSSAISIPSTAGRHFGAHPQPVAVGIDNVVDIRGARYDEALTQVEVFLDRALASDLDVVVVRHGHGSGALRKAVREHLPGLAHVVAVRPGLPDEGGDAVTVVWLAG